MAFKERVVDLVLRMRDQFSAGAKSAADSARSFTNTADKLQDRLRKLEDQKSLISQFQKTARTVDRTSTAYDRAKNRLVTLEERISKTGKATAKQARDLDFARKAVEKADREYDEAKDSLDAYAKEAKKAGVSLGNLNESQRENEKATRKAKRELQDFNKATESGASKVGKFRKRLSDGIVTLAKWGGAAAAAGAAASVAILTRFTAQQADLARQTLASAKAFNISTTELQKWRIAGEAVGIQGDKIADIMKDVGEKIGDAFLNGGGEAREVVKGLGLDIEDLAKLRPDEIILKISERLEGLPKSGQIQIMEALANDASLLLPLLENNAEKLRELGAEAEKRGQIFSKEELERLAEVDRNFKKLSQRVSSFTKEAVVKMAPAFNKAAKALDDALSDKPELVEKISDAAVGLIETTADWVEALVRDGSTAKATFTSITQAARGMASIFEGAFRVVQTIVSGALTLWAAGFTVMLQRAESVAFVLNKLGRISDESYSKIKFHADAAAQGTIDLARETIGYGEKVIGAGGDAVAAFGKSRDAASEAAGALSENVATITDLGDALEAMGSKQEEAGEKSRKLAGKVAELSQQLFDAEDALEKAGAALTDSSTKEARAEYEALRKEVETLTGKIHELRNQQRVESVNSADGSSYAAVTAEGYREAAEEIEKTGDAAERTFERIVVLGEELSQSADKVRDVADQAEATAGSVGGSIAAIFNSLSNRIANLSAKAGKAFQERLGFRAAASDASVLESRLEAIDRRLTNLDLKISNGSTISRLLRDWSRAALQTEKAFLQQAIAVERLTDEILNGGRAAQHLHKDAKDLEKQFDLLDGDQLRPLIGAIQSARREMEALNDSVLDTIASAEQEIASLQGDLVEVERLRFLEKEAELQALIDQAEKSGDKEAVKNARRALELSKQAFDLRKAQAEERAKEERSARAAREADRERDRQDSEREERQDISRDERRTQQQTTQLDNAISDQFVTLDLRAGGQSLGQLSRLDPFEVERLIEAIRNSGYLSAD